MKINFKISTKDIGESLRKKMEVAIDSVSEEMRDDSIKLMQEGYDNSELQVRTQNLYNSYKFEKTKKGIKVSSNLVYSRIHEVGGFTGRNYKTYIKPRLYFSKGADLLVTSFFDKLINKIRGMR